MKFTLTAAAALAVLTLGAAPSFEEFAGRIRPDHPRMFLTRETLPGLPGTGEYALQTAARRHEEADRRAPRRSPGWNSRPMSPR